MYTATIKNKTFINGKLTVEVIYSNGEESLPDTYSSNQAQDESWLSDRIKRKLNDLNSLSFINDSIIVGEFKFDKSDKSNTEIYQDKAMQYMKYMDIARMGIIQSDRPIINELREWLKDNFKNEYVNIF